MLKREKKNVINDAYVLIEQKFMKFFLIIIHVGREYYSYECKVRDVKKVFTITTNKAEIKPV